MSGHPYWLIPSVYEGVDEMTTGVETMKMHQKKLKESLDNNPQVDSELVTKALEKEVSGGPSSYYDFPYQDWITTNDQMEYLAEHKWGKYGIHLKDIFKGLCRWGDKRGTTQTYDAEKIVYYGVRVLKMLVGVAKTRIYLQRLLDDPQFQTKEDEKKKPGTPCYD